jgi:hypothetical protein
VATKRVKQRLSTFFRLLDVEEPFFLIFFVVRFFQPLIDASMGLTILALFTVRSGAVAVEPLH